MFGKASLRNLLTHLVEVDSKINVSRSKQLLRAIWGADSVDIVTSDGRPIHGRTLLENALAEVESLQLRVTFNVAPEGEFASVARAESAHLPPEGREPRESGTPAEDGDVDADAPPPSPHIAPVVERAIRELAGRERTRDFIWAGFVVNELLPRLGVDKREAQELFDRMVDEGILALRKRPNPNNPDFPTTTVELVRSNEVVQQVLRTEANGRRRFEPVPIRGEPASETTVRERR